MTPAELTPALRTDRLQLLAREIRRVRLDALEVFQPEKGDNAWSFGCLCYVRTCAALSQLEASRKHSWLRLEVDGLACTILVEGEPIKFYTGDPKRPSDRARRHGLEQAIAQGRLPFMEEEYAATEGWFWLMAIDTVEDGTVGLRDPDQTFLLDVSPGETVPRSDESGPAARVAPRGPRDGPQRAARL